MHIWGYNIPNQKFKLIQEIFTARSLNKPSITRNDTHLIPTSLISPEAPPTFWSTWEGLPDVYRSLLFAGHLNLHYLTDIAHMHTPPYKLPSLYRTFHIKILTQLHKHWKQHSTQTKDKQPSKKYRKGNQKLTQPSSQKPTNQQQNGIHTEKKINDNNVLCLNP